VEADEICSMLSAGMMDDTPYDGNAIATSLVDAANTAGGVDNITVVLMNFEKSKNKKMKDENA